jgi:hypothetical protein
MPDDCAERVVDPDVATFEVEDHHPDQRAIKDATESFAAGRELEFVGAAFGEIARDLPVATQHAVLIAERGNHDVCPEPASVFADPPPLVLEPALSSGNRKLACRLAREHILGWVEDREMPPDDLLRPIPLNPLRTRVPAQDEPTLVKHQDRVILRFGDQHRHELVVEQKSSLVAVDASDGAAGYVSHGAPSPK